MVISDNINDREKNKFDLGNEVFVRTDEQKVTIIDRVNSNLTYEGRALHGSLESDPVWQIKRTIKSGTITKTIYADSGNYTQIWDNRNTIFTPGAVLNLYSTNFDGVNDYVDFGDIHNFTYAQAFSFSIWINVNNLASSRYIVSQMDATAPVTGWRMLIDTTGKIETQLRSTVGTYGFNTFDTVLSAATWYHIVWTYNGGSNVNGQKLYINGALDTHIPASQVLSGGGWGTSVSMTLGQSLSTGYFSGMMDEFAFYNKELSATEISEIYNSGNPNDLETLTTSGNLISWWRMGDDDTYPTILDLKGVGDGTMTNMVAGNFVTDVP